MPKTITELFNNTYAVGAPDNNLGSLTFSAPDSSRSLIRPIEQPQYINFLDGGRFGSFVDASLDNGGSSLPSISNIVGPELKLNNKTSLASPFRNAGNVRVIG